MSGHQFRKIEDQPAKGAHCVLCHSAQGQVFRIRDARQVGSKSETLHEECAAGWFGQARLLSN
jgi:hypothetical protein